MFREQKKLLRTNKAGFKKKQLFFLAEEVLGVYEILKQIVNPQEDTIPPTSENEKITHESFAHQSESRANLSQKKTLGFVEFFKLVEVVNSWGLDGTPWDHNQKVGNDTIKKL